MLFSFQLRSKQPREFANVMRIVKKKSYIKPGRDPAVPSYVPLKSGLFFPHEGSFITKGHIPLAPTFNPAGLESRITGE